MRNVWIFAMLFFNLEILAQAASDSQHEFARVSGHVTNGDVPIKGATVRLSYINEAGVELSKEVTTSTNGGFAVYVPGSKDVKLEILLYNKVCYTEHFGPVQKGVVVKRDPVVCKY